jgi:hypothetical protein
MQVVPNEAAAEQANNGRVWFWLLLKHKLAATPRPQREDTVAGLSCSQLLDDLAWSIAQSLSPQRRSDDCLEEEDVQQPAQAFAGTSHRSAPYKTMLHLILSTRCTLWQYLMVCSLSPPTDSLLQTSETAKIILRVLRIAWRKQSDTEHERVLYHIVSAACERRCPVELAKVALDTVVKLARQSLHRGEDAQSHIATAILSTFRSRVSWLWDYQQMDEVAR